MARGQGSGIADRQDDGERIGAGAGNVMEGGEAGVAVGAEEDDAGWLVEQGCGGEEGRKSGKGGTVAGAANDRQLRPWYGIPPRR